MEIDQPKSKFRITPMSEILPTSEEKFFIDGMFFSRCGAIKLSKLYRKIISKSYGVLDSLSGSASYFLKDFPNDFCSSPMNEIFHLLVSRGLIYYQIDDSRYNDSPYFYRLYINANYPKGATDGNIPPGNLGGGAGKNPEKAISRAIGEFLERYFLTLYRKKQFFRGSVNDLKKKNLLPIDLKLLAGFSEEQKKENPRRQFDENSLFYWERVRRISANEDVFAPAQFVHWNYKLDELEPCLCEGNTNGAGGWFSKEGAILSGLYELIQRDAFLIYWLNRLTPKRIDPYSVPNEDFQKLLQESERYGFEVYCLNITSDISVPAFAVIISDPTGKGPRFSLGAGCQADPCGALCRAFEEAWSIYNWVRRMPAYPVSNEKDRQFLNPEIGQTERVRLWGNPEMAKHLEFFLRGKEESLSDIKFDFPRNFVSQKEELYSLTKKIEAKGPGYEIYCYLAKHPILSEIGYYSAQIIIPCFIPMYLRDSNAPLGNSRIKEAPKKMGLAPASEINPLPHLFP